MSVNIGIMRQVYLDGVLQVQDNGANSYSSSGDKAYMDSYYGTSTSTFVLNLSTLEVSSAIYSFIGEIETTFIGAYLDYERTSQPLVLGYNTCPQNYLGDYSGQGYNYDYWVTSYEFYESNSSTEEDTTVDTSKVLVINYNDIAKVFYMVEDNSELLFTDSSGLYISADGLIYDTSKSGVDTTAYSINGFCVDEELTTSLTNSTELTQYLVDINEVDNDYWATTYPNHTHILYVYENCKAIDTGDDDTSSDGSSTGGGGGSTDGGTTPGVDIPTGAVKGETTGGFTIEKTVPVCFRIGAVDYSMYVNELKITSSATYNKQTNAHGDSFVDYINHKRTIDVGIIPLNNTVMALLLKDIDKFSVSLTFLNPQTGKLETNVRCIIPKSNVEYYTIQSNKISFKAFSLSFIEL